jgi:hypothetical protein
MTAKFSRLTHKTAIQLHLVAETCIICSSRSRRLVRKLLDTPSYFIEIIQIVVGVKYLDGRRPSSHKLFFCFVRLGHGLDDRGCRVRFPAGGWEFFPSPPRPERHWGPPSLLSSGYRGALSLGVKRPGREADHSPSSSAEVKNAWSYTSTPPIRLLGVVLS